MIILNVLILFLCVFESQQSADYHDRYQRGRNVRNAGYRMIEMMQGYYEDGCARITSLNDMRFMFEETPHYELGYVIGEIIERYRKMVSLAQQPFRQGIMVFFDMLRYLEYLQKLYFEIYHLVRMVHEIPRKYSSDPEFSKIESLIGPDVASNSIPGAKKKKKTPKDDIQKRREKEMRKQKKQFQKLRKLFLAGKIGNPNAPKTEKPNWWGDVDYGWEIDYYW